MKDKRPVTAPAGAAPPKGGEGAVEVEPVFDAHRTVKRRYFFRDVANGDTTDLNPFFQHFDVFVSPADEHDTILYPSRTVPLKLSDSIDFNTLYYVDSKKEFAVDEMMKEKGMHENKEGSTEVNLNELVHYLVKLRPRSKEDAIPLSRLLQSVLKKVINQQVVHDVKEKEKQLAAEYLSLRNASITRLAEILKDEKQALMSVQEKLQDVEGVKEHSMEALKETVLMLEKATGRNEALTKELQNTKIALEQSQDITRSLHNRTVQLRDEVDKATAKARKAEQDLRVKEMHINDQERRISVMMKSKKDQEKAAQQKATAKARKAEQDLRVKEMHINDQERRISVMMKSKKDQEKAAQQHDNQRARQREWMLDRLRYHTAISGSTVVSREDFLDFLTVATDVVTTFTEATGTYIAEKQAVQEEDGKGFGVAASIVSGLRLAKLFSQGGLVQADNGTAVHSMLVNGEEVDIADLTDHIGVNAAKTPKILLNYGTNTVGGGCFFGLPIRDHRGDIVAAIAADTLAEDGQYHAFADGDKDFIREVAVFLTSAYAKMGKVAEAEAKRVQEQVKLLLETKARNLEQVKTAVSDMIGAKKFIRLLKSKVEEKEEEEDKVDLDALHRLRQSYRALLASIQEESEGNEAMQFHAGMIRASSLLKVEIEDSIQRLERGHLEEVKRYNSPPPAAKRVIIAVLAILGEPIQEIKEWIICRRKINFKRGDPTNLFSRMESYHPAADAELLSTEREECYQAAMASMDGLSRDHVSSSSVRLSILYEWVHVVLEMRQHAKKWMEAKEEAKAGAK
eukprot:CAMPEP_0113916194 /NCGR_PEP_ID=MMETSP0780_2-20120614/31844_1 /TAXON_ID=652834 /ORGANISM="Palpitomonas bilix" /LENGTH=796 /DNA_ID=CAMNT_0000915231 /DNA_START=45 /DNA_END=2436 /DNA_ORIENTATION=- /assembly_acc=CAM_ASM_000599